MTIVISDRKLKYKTKKYSLRKTLDKITNLQNNVKGLIILLNKWKEEYEIKYPKTKNSNKRFKVIIKSCKNDRFFIAIRLNKDLKSFNIRVSVDKVYVYEDGNYINTQITYNDSVDLCLFLEEFIKYCKTNLYK